LRNIPVAYSPWHHELLVFNNLNLNQQITISKQVGLFHYPDKLFLVDLPVSVTVRLVDHLLQLFVGHRLSQFAGHSLQVFQRDLASSVVVEQAEGLKDLLPGISLGDLAGHEFHEVAELDDAFAFTIDLRDHLFDFLFLGFESESSHSHFEFFCVDVS
jgi:hypothetical protein